MAEFYMLIGLQASGKSMIAKETLEHDGFVIVSSDSIRKELFGDETFQGDNNKVFEVAHKRIKDSLNEGKNVMFDATNVNRKKRMHLINNEIKADKKVAVYMAIPYSECVLRDSLRERSVGEDVIARTYKNLQIPTMNEGWDEILVVHPEDMSWNRAFGLMNFMDVLKEDMGYESFIASLTLAHIGFDAVVELPHDSSYHVFSVGRHIYHAWKHIMENYSGLRKQELLASVIFHDIGKGFCKSFTGRDGFTKRYANFISHENVGAQIASIELHKLGYQDDFINYVVDLVQFHMDVCDMNGKKEARLRKLLGEEAFNDLMILHEADRSGR